MDMLYFASAFLLSAIIPGPDILSASYLAIVGSKDKFIVYAIGIILGKLIILTLCLFFSSIFLNLLSKSFLYLIAGSYLIYIGARTYQLTYSEKKLTAGCTILNFRQALMLALSNPQAIAFYLTILPITENSDSTHQSKLFLYIIIIAIMSLIFIFYFYLFNNFQYKFYLHSNKAKLICCGLINVLGLVIFTKGLFILFKEMT